MSGRFERVNHHLNFRGLGAREHEPVGVVVWVEGPGRATRAATDPMLESELDLAQTEPRNQLRFYATCEQGRLGRLAGT